jgi:hypothetical protein
MSDLLFGAILGFMAGAGLVIVLWALAVLRNPRN